LIDKSKNKNIISNIISRQNNINSLDLLKLIIKNRNITIKYKLPNAIKIYRNKIYRNKICVVTGRYKAVNKNLNITRQIVNQYAIKNKLDNISIATW